MGRPRLTDSDKALKMLRADEAKQLAELKSISPYAGPYWTDYRAEVEAALGRTQGAIRSVQEKGVPEGWAEKWGIG